MPIYTLPELKLIFRFISMKNVHFALDGWICFDGSCRFAQSGLVLVEGGNGRGKKKKHILCQMSVFPFIAFII